MRRLLADDKLRNFAVFDITGAPDPVTGAGEYAYRQYNDDTDLSWQSSVNYQYQRLNFEGLSPRTTGLSATTRSTTRCLMYHMDRYQQSGSYYKFNTAGFGFRAHYGFKENRCTSPSSQPATMARNSICRGAVSPSSPPERWSWAISKENFLKDSKVVNYLKLRASVRQGGRFGFHRRFCHRSVSSISSSITIRALTLSVCRARRPQSEVRSRICWLTLSLLGSKPEEDRYLESQGTFFNHVNLMFDYFHDVRKDILNPEHGLAASHDGYRAEPAGVTGRRSDQSRLRGYARGVRPCRRFRVRSSGRHLVQSQHHQQAAGCESLRPRHAVSISGSARP